MPLKSKAQERFLWAQKPKLAQEFENDTPEGAKLPEHVKMAQGGKVIKQDGKEYVFNPGKNGSLIAMAPKDTPPPSLADFLSTKPVGPSSGGPSSVAKVIAPTENQPKKMASGGDPGMDDATNKYLLQEFEDTTNHLPFGADAPGTNAPQAVQSPTPPTPAQHALAQTDTGTDKTLSDAERESRIKPASPAHAPEDLLGAELTGKMAEAGKYGPDQEQAVIQDILKSQGSLGNRFARAGAGLGDAIMAVAGKQSPGFLNSLENREQNRAKTAIESVPMLQKMQEAKMGAQDKYEMMGAGTPLAESQKASLAALFARLGVPAPQIPAILRNPAAARSVLEPYTQMMSKDEQVRMETMLKELELAQRGQGMQQEATKTLAGQGLLSHFANKLFHPGVNEKMEQEAGLGGAPHADKNSGPYGPTTVRNGKTYAWSPVSKKYHPQ